MTSMKEITTHLDGLKQEILQCEQKIELAARDALESGRRQGQALDQARAFIADDEDGEITFSEWLQTFDFDADLARRRIELSRRWEQLPLAGLTLEAAERKALSTNREPKLAPWEQERGRGIFADDYWSRAIDLYEACLINLANAEKDVKNLGRWLNTIANKQATGIPVSEVDINEAKEALEECGYIAQT